VADAPLAALRGYSRAVTTLRSLFAVLLLELLASVSTAQAAARPPNVLVILTDDQRWDAMSVAGHPFLKTPNMDRLANEGARFTNVFVTTSLCSPSRASLLSGRYAHGHKIRNNFSEYPTDLPSYPRRLHDAGYETAYIGKWHMGEKNDSPRPGFDHWMSHAGQGNYFDTEFNVDGRRKLMKGYYTTVVTDHAVEWLARPRTKPFLLILGHKAPHGGPITPEPKYEHAFDKVQVSRPPTADDLGVGKPGWLKESIPTWHGIGGPLYGQKDFGKFVRAYLATLLSVDDSVGRIYQALVSAGQLDDTIIIFTSDNGFALGEHGRVDKRTMYEESIRVPLLVRYPKLIPRPLVIAPTVLNIDLAPSIVDLCGLGTFRGAHGMSWKRLLSGKANAWRTAWMYEYNYETEFPYTPNVRGVRTAEWKYIHYPPGGTGDQSDKHKAELYNVKADPLETRNLIDDPKAAPMLAQLRAELERILRATDGWPDRPPQDGGIKTALPRF
jgi:arylsulfatase A-like enzyme